MDSPLEMVDPVLGLMRYCRGCGEWWPKDRDFYYFERSGKVIGRCRACWSERSAHTGRAFPPILPLPGDTQPVT